MKFCLGNLLALSLAFTGCFYDVDDESDYAPSVGDVVGCWLSTENVGEATFMHDWVTVYPSKTCIEFCLQSNSSFTYVAKITGSENFSDFSTDLYGIVEVAPVTILGTGGNVWGFFWNKRNVSVFSDGDSTKHNYDFKGSSEVRLVDGKLRGLHFGQLNFKNKNEYLSSEAENGRKFCRTNDKNACDDGAAK